MKYDKNYVVAVDFDNTITLNSTYEQTGRLNPAAKDALLRLKQMGCVLVLWTCRAGADLEEAKTLLREWNIPFDYYNEYPLREGSNKVNVDFYIDDKSYTTEIDWNKIIQFIKGKL